MTGNIFIEHESVQKIGKQLSHVTHQAIADTNKYFDSQKQAAADNPGFSTGEHLVSYADKLHSQINNCLNSLSDNAQSIVKAAQTYESAEQHSACLLDDNTNPTGDDPGLSMDFQSLKDAGAAVTPGLLPD